MATTKAKTAPVALLFGLALAPAALIGLSSTATSTAQAAPSYEQKKESYEQKKEMCRQEGSFRLNLTGDHLTRFVDDCVAEGSGTSSPTAIESYEAKVQACRNDGAYRQRLSGDALQAFVAMCLGR
jgi:hypothetical protein